MEVRIRQGKEHESEAFARFHRVACDQPFDQGGYDAGMTPLELMLAALGCCAVQAASQYLRDHHFAVDDLELRVHGVEGERTRAFASIGIEVDAPGLRPWSRDGLIQAIENCAVSRVLANPPPVSVNMATSLVEGASATRVADVAS